MKASHSTWLAVGVLAVVAAAAPTRSGWAAGPRDGAVDVRVTSGRLSVRVAGATLADVLRAVGREANLKIILHGAIDNLVNEEFVSMPLDEAVRRLTRWHSVVLIYRGQRGDAADAALAEVWVTGASSDRVADRNNDGGFKRSTEVETRPAHVRREQEPDARPPGLTIVLRSGPSDSRTQLINALVQERGEYAVVQILRDAATRDPNPRVRRGAIQVLAALKSPEAIEAVQGTVHDEHPGVRGEAETALRRLRRAHVAD